MPPFSRQEGAKAALLSSSVLTNTYFSGVKVQLLIHNSYFMVHNYCLFVPICHPTARILVLCEAPHRKWHNVGLCANLLSFCCFCTLWKMVFLAPNYATFGNAAQVIGRRSTLRWPMLHVALAFPLCCVRGLHKPKSVQKHAKTARFTRCRCQLWIMCWELRIVTSWFSAQTWFNRVSLKKWPKPRPKAF